MADNAELHAHERGPGSVLAAARAAQNLSVADVARRLKLSAQQVAALEADAYERLPGPVFVRGFVRNYARLLNMDADRILAMLSDPDGSDLARIPTKRGVPFSSTSVRRWPRLIVLALVAVGVLAAYEFYLRDRGLFRAGVEQPAPTGVLAVPEERAGSVVAAVAVEPPSVPAPQPPPAAAPETIPAASDTAVLAKVAPPSDAVSPQSTTPSAAASTEPASAASEEGELRFLFNRESWVQVRDGDGKTIFTRLNRAGSEQRVAGKPPFTLVIGNADGVRLSFNDRPVDLARHIVGGGVARFTLP